MHSAVKFSYIYYHLRLLVHHELNKFNLGLAVWVKVPKDLLFYQLSFCHSHFLLYPYLSLEFGF